MPPLPHWPLVLMLLWAAPAAAAPVKICAWMTETVDAESNHEFSLWLEADADIQIYYQMAGEGVVTESMRAHSPGSGTFVLHPGEPDKPWGFGATLNPPGEVDIVAEIHETPEDIFSDVPSPLLTAFEFRRHVPEGETTPPPIFAEKRCRTVAAKEPARP